MELKLEGIIKAIESFKELERNWNGYDAEPIPEAVINKALELAKQLQPTPEFVAPTARRSIQFEWEVDGLYTEVEVFNDKIEIFSIAKHDDKDVYIGNN